MSQPASNSEAARGVRGSCLAPLVCWGAMMSIGACCPSSEVQVCRTSVWPASPSPVAPEPAVSPDRHNWVLPDEEAATARALGIFGPCRLTTAPLAVLVRLARDESPYIHAILEAAPIWQVSIDADVLLWSFGVATERVLFARRFAVLLDARTGQLLKLVSRGDGEAELAAMPANAQSAERQFMDGGSEVWTGLPAESPRTSFVDALRHIEEAGFGLADAHDFVGHCVLWSFMDRPPVAAWSIYTGGIQPIPAAYPGVPPEALNHLRHIVSAEDGRWLMADSAPQSDAPSDRPTPGASRVPIGPAKE